MFLSVWCASGQAHVSLSLVRFGPSARVIKARISRVAALHSDFDGRPSVAVHSSVRQDAVVDCGTGALITSTPDCIVFGMITGS
jgi:hypothetical protein